MNKQTTKTDYGTQSRQQFIQQIVAASNKQGMCELCGEWDSKLQEGACDYCNKRLHIIPERAA